MTTRIEHLTCTGCSCLCDDLNLELTGESLSSAENACELSEAEFLSRITLPSDVSPWLDGQPVKFDTAIQRAADLLRESRAPLIFLAETAGTETYRAACRLSDRLGATLDTCADQRDAASMLAMQSAGMSTATLGEVRARADLIIYWGVDPVQSHPRHVERFVETPGVFIPRGRQGRQVMVVDIKATATAEIADRFLQVQPDGDLELIWSLRAALAGKSHEKHSACLEVVEQLKSCRYGAVFFGRGLASSVIGHAPVEGLLRLVRELNAFTRFVAVPMDSPGKASGADSVLAWQTGFPMAVNFAAGYPRYSPGEYSAGNLLERAEVDAVVMVGSKSIERLASSAEQQLNRLPVISIGMPVHPQDNAKVVIPTAVDGVHVSGTCHRMDGVALPLRKIIASSLPSAGQVLAGIEEAIGKTGLSTTSSQAGSPRLSANQQETVRDFPPPD